VEVQIVHWFDLLRVLAFTDACAIVLLRNVFQRSY